jgi:hypothetical protein
VHEIDALAEQRQSCCGALLALQFFPFSARSFAYRAGMSSKAGRSLSTWMSRFDRLNALGLDGNLRRRDVAQKFCAAAEWDQIVIQQQ